MTSLSAIIESIFFTAESALTLDKLCDLLPEHDRESIKEAIVNLSTDLVQRQGAIRLVEVAGGWQLRTDPIFQEYVVRQIKTKSTRFSPSALETLAIIAYRQPVTRVEIEHLRGVDSGGVVKSLLEKKLVKILGKKDIPGRPIIYGTSKVFLEMFGLKDLKSLPTLKEIEALDETPNMERQEELPLGNTMASPKDADLPFGE